MYIHSGHIRLIIPLHHTQEFPAIPLIKSDMIRHQIYRRNALVSQIADHLIQQSSGNTLSAHFFLSIHGTHIGRKILSVVKVIFDYSQSSHNVPVLQAQIPAYTNVFPNKIELRLS